MDHIIASLLNERAGYVQRGLKDRVSQVDAQLTALGHKSAPRVETASVEPETERAVTSKRTKRVAD